MAYKLPNGDILRNLQEQVQKNKEDIQRHYEVDRIIADWGIRIIGRMDEWKVPTGSFEYGDAYAVGPEGGPFVFYIYTRGNPDYWFDYGAISIIGPQGPEGPQGEKGDTGDTIKWHVGNNQPKGPDIKVDDQWLNSNNGNVYTYIENQGMKYWSLRGSLRGPQGIPGLPGPKGDKGDQGIPGEPGPRGVSTITNVIGTLPEGSIISNIYNPAEQPDNATILMPVNGETHAFIIINGKWTDAGPYSGGSAVYVNGEYQQTFNADTKVTKQNPGYNSLYAVSNAGVDWMVSLAPAGTRSGNSVARYGPGGNLQTADPKGVYDCTNKQYVDNAIAQAHGELQHAVLKYYVTPAEPTTFTVDLGTFIDPNNPVIPNGFILYGIGGYTFVNGGWFPNGPSINQLIYTDSAREIVIQQYLPGSTGNGVDLAKFTVDNIYNLPGTTLVKMTLTQTSTYPTTGILVFDCIPH